MVAQTYITREEDRGHEQHKEKRHVETDSVAAADAICKRMAKVGTHCCKRVSIVYISLLKLFITRHIEVTSKKAIEALITPLGHRLDELYPNAR